MLGLNGKTVAISLKLTTWYSLSELLLPWIWTNCMLIHFMPSLRTFYNTTIKSHGSLTPLLYAEFRTQKMIACCRYWLAQHVTIQNLDLLISKLILVLKFFLNVFDFLFSRSKLFLSVLGKIASWILLLHKSKINYVLCPIYCCVRKLRCLKRGI